MLKIGTLCWITRAEGPFKPLIGHVAEITGRLCKPARAQWEMYPVAIHSVLPKPEFAEPECLLPFSDPDISRPEHTLKPIERVA